MWLKDLNFRTDNANCYCLITKFYLSFQKTQMEIVDLRKELMLKNKQIVELERQCSEMR